jgi:uncharacterized protein (DUF2235 family)
MEQALPHDDIGPDRQADPAERDVDEAQSSTRAPRPRGRRLVMCCDGTWNNPDKLSNGVPAPTNVAKVAMGVARRDHTGAHQLLYYQPGVGTRRSERVRGGAFGYGLSRNVLACYSFIVETYQPGDELYFFGFSRGAYTARSTVGLIHNCGILRSEHRNRLVEAYALYKSRDDHKKPCGIEAKLFRRSYSYDDVKIRFVGVWDTVGAVGIPIDGLPIPPFITRHWGFHNTKLSSSVLSAYQALAIDERRRPFKPALWTRRHEREGQDVEQVWFSGAHQDVGGGSSEPSLSEIPLLWMVDRACACALAFTPGHFAKKCVCTRASGDGVLARAQGEWVHGDALGPLHNSFRGWYPVLGPTRRALVDPANGDPAVNGECVAVTAVERLEGDPAYRPSNLLEWRKRDQQAIDVVAR